MGRGADGSPSALDVVLHHWPLLIFVPAVLVLLGTFIGITRWWDLRDGMRVADKTVSDRWRFRRRRVERCTCSWHTIATEVRAENG
jgi:hypothetical protein